MYNQTTRYEIQDTFYITGRGIVFAGQILEGEVCVGDLIKFKVNDEFRIRKIEGLESINRGSQERANTGLLIQCKDKKEEEEFKKWQANKAIAEIEKGSL